MFRGGRGNKAPYETTHVRIPVPILQPVNNLIRLWHESCMEGNLDYSSSTTTLEELTGKRELSRVDAIETAKDILRQKKSARISMEKLLTAIYEEEIRL